MRTWGISLAILLALSAPAGAARFGTLRSAVAGKSKVLLDSAGKPIGQDFVRFKTIGPNVIIGNQIPPAYWARKYPGFIRDKIAMTAPPQPALRDGTVPLTRYSWAPIYPSVSAQGTALGNGFDDLHMLKHSNSLIGVYATEGKSGVAGPERFATLVNRNTGVSFGQPFGAIEETRHGDLLGRKFADRGPWQLIDGKTGKAMSAEYTKIVRSWTGKLVAHTSAGHVELDPQTGRVMNARASR